MNLMDDDLNQKLTKHSQKMLDMGRLHGGKYLRTNLGVEEGGGRLLEEGPIFGSLRYDCFIGAMVCTFQRMPSCSRKTLPCPINV